MLGLRTRWIERAVGSNRILLYLAGTTLLLSAASGFLMHAIDDEGFTMLQARPLHLEAPHVPDEIWMHHPRLSGHPAGIGWGTGRAVVINCECEISRIAPGDVLVTRVAGPALAHMLSQVSGVVTERGGSTSHMASLARERGIPMVLGVADATRRIPDGAQVAVDEEPRACKIIGLVQNRGNELTLAAPRLAL